MVTKNFSRERVHQVGKMKYVIRAVGGYTLSFGNESAQQLVVTRICSLLPRRKRMCKIHACSRFFCYRKRSKFRTVIGSNCFEYIGEMSAEALF